MLINKKAQAYIDRIFSAPLDYDMIQTEIGENSEESTLALKAYKEGKLVYYLNYELLNLIGE